MRVAIVGGGITGLAAAYALAGHEVLLFERGPRLGGKILTERLDGFLLEAGPDSFLTTKPQAVEVSRALGLGDELIGTSPGRTVYVLSRGRLHPLPEGLMLIAPTKVAPFLRSGLFSWGEKARIAADLLVPPGRDGDESLGAFVRRRMGRAALDRLAAPLLAGIYAGDAERLSLQATFPQLRELERRHGSLIAGVLAQRRTAGAGAGDGRLPLFMTIRGGLDRLVGALAAASGADVRTGTEVAAIGPDGAGYVLDLAAGGRVDVDALILATPSYAAADLLATLAPEAAALLRQIAYASTATISLAYREEELPRLAGHGFVVARSEGYRITACTWASAKWPDRAPPGYGLLRAYVGSASDPRALDRSDAEIIALVRSDLAEAMRLTASPILARVSRWPRSMPQYALGHLERLAEVERLLSWHPRFSIAGAGYRGIGLPDCIKQGMAAAARVVS